MAQLDALLEAERRGILPDDKKAVLAEARRRGLVPGAKPPFFEAHPGRFPVGISAAGRRGIAAGIARVPTALSEAVGAAMRGAGLKPDPLESPGEWQARVEAQRAAEAEAVPYSVGAGDVAASLIPTGVGAVSRAGGGLKTLARMVPATAAEGAIASQIPFQAPEDRIANAALGAGFGATLAYGANLRPRLMNMVKTALQRRRDPATAALDAQVQDAFTNPVTGDPLTEIKPTIMQEMGDPKLSQLGQSSTDILARDVTRKQLDDTLRNMDTVINSYGPAPSAIEQKQAASAVSKLVRDADVQMRSARGTRFRTDTEKLAASPEGRKMHIPVSGVKTIYEDVQGQFSNVFALAKNGAAGKALADAIGELDIASKVAPDIGMDVRGYRKLVEGLNAKLDWEGPITETSAQLFAFRNALRRRVEDLVDSLPANAPGKAEMVRIRGEYRAASDNIRRLEEDQLTKLFGYSPAAEADPQRAFESFSRANPAAQQTGVDILSNRNPALLAYFKRASLQKIRDEAVNPARPASASQLDTGRLATLIADPNIMRSPLWTETEKKWLAGMSANLRRIRNFEPIPNAAGAPVGGHEIAATVVGMHEVFLARTFFRLVNSYGLESVLYSQEGRTALKTFANVDTATQAAIRDAGAAFAAIDKENRDRGEAMSGGQ